LAFDFEKLYRTLTSFEGLFFDQYKSSTAPLLALEALNANLACTPRV
jgi:hypothetical protein